MMPLKNETEYKKEEQENQEFVRNLVLHSHEDIAKGNGREYKEVFLELRERYNKNEL